MHRATEAQDGAAVWIVFKCVVDGYPEFQGVFASEQRAIAACSSATHCVCPAIVGVDTGPGSKTWPGVWFPHLQPRPGRA